MNHAELTQELEKLADWAEQENREDVPYPEQLKRALVFAQIGQYDSARWALRQFEGENYMIIEIEQRFRNICGEVTRLIGGT